MNKIIVYIYEGMADFEISLLIHLLGAGKEIITISNDTIVKSKSGFLFKPHKVLNEVVLDDVEGIIIPGGWDKNLDDELLSIIEELNRDGKLVAAICAAPWILAKAGILEGHRYTTTIEEWQNKHTEFFGIDNPFPKDGYVNERVVKDRNIITAKGMAFIDFAIEVCESLGLFNDTEERSNFERELKGH